MRCTEVPIGRDRRRIETGPRTFLNRALGSEALVMPTGPAGADVSLDVKMHRVQDLDGELHIREAGALLETCEVKSASHPMTRWCTLGSIPIGPCSSSWAAGSLLPCMYVTRTPCKAGALLAEDPIPTLLLIGAWVCRSNVGRFSQSSTGTSCRRPSRLSRARTR